MKYIRGKEDICDPIWKAQKPRSMSIWAISLLSKSDQAHHSTYYAISHCWVEFSWETLCVKSMIFLESLKCPKCKIDAFLKDNKCRERHNKFPGILKL